MEVILGAADFSADEARLASMLAHGLQTRGPLELGLGDRIGSL